MSSIGQILIYEKLSRLEDRLRSPRERAERERQERRWAAEYAKGTVTCFDLFGALFLFIIWLPAIVVGICLMLKIIKFICEVVNDLTSSFIYDAVSGLTSSDIFLISLFLVPSTIIFVGYKIETKKKQNKRKK